MSEEVGGVNSKIGIKDIDRYHEVNGIPFAPSFFAGKKAVRLSMV